MFILIATIGLLRVICTESTTYSLDDRIYHFRTLALFVCLMIPGIVSLCIWNFGIGSVFHVPSSTLFIPFALGFALHLMLLILYGILCTSSAVQRLMDTELEKLELEILCEMRTQCAGKTSQLKTEFLQNDTTSQRLIDIMQMLAFQKKPLGK